MSDPVKEIAEVFRTEFLALAFLGALIALSFWPVADRRKAGLNVLVGTVVSGVTAPVVTALVVWKWPDFPLTVPVMAAVYFWLGLLGMQVVPVVAAILRTLRKLRIVEAGE